MARELSELTYEKLVETRKRALLEGRIMAFGELSEQLQIDPDSYDEFSEERKLWDLYNAEKMWLADQSINVQRPKPVLDVPSKNEKIRYRINSYSDAQRIIDGFSRSEPYLRSLIKNVTGSPKFVGGLDYRGLLHEGYKIRGIAQKIVETTKR